MNRIKSAGDSGKKRAFTLFELLVVIAIIALLLMGVMPGLNMDKKKAASAVCLNEIRHMSIAWGIYAGENDSRIMSATIENSGVQAYCKNGWIGQPHTAADTTSSSLSLIQTSPTVTDEDEIRGASRGKLYPYLKSPGTYHCPADKLRIGPDGTRLYVSYAIAMYLNGNPDSFKDQIRKLSEITSPGKRYNFVESGENSRGNWIMGGRFPIAAPEYGADGYGLWGPVAISHGNSNAFGFVDGRAEIRKRHSSAIFDHYTTTENIPPGSLYGFQAVGSKHEDILWLVQG